MVTIKQIQSFLVLAKELHFAKSANLLGISQSTLSCEIKKMEDKLGFKLFDRSDKWEIKLTEAGQHYLHLVEKIPSDINFAAEDANRVARGELGILNISAASMVYESVNLARIYKLMMLHYPDIKIRQTEYFSPEIVTDKVLNHRADIGFTVEMKHIELLNSSLAFQKINLWNAKLVVSRNHRLAFKESISWEDIKNQSFIYAPVSRMPNMVKRFSEIFTRHTGQELKVSYEAESVLGIQQFVAEGMGISILPEHSMNYFPHDIVFRDFPFDLSSSFGVIYLRDSLSPIKKNFLKILNSYLESLPNDLES